MLIGCILSAACSDDLSPLQPSTTEDPSGRSKPRTTPGLLFDGYFVSLHGMSITRVFGQHDEKTLAQLQDVAQRAERVALMADGHMGYVMPIGGVGADREKDRGVGVGVDNARG